MPRTESGGKNDDPIPGPRPIFVDTNVFLRFLTNDVPEQAAAAEALFRRAQVGQVKLITSTMVLAEIVWVLESYYKLSRAGVRERASAVAHMEGLYLAELDIVTDALFAYESSNVDFVDAYNACWAKEHGVISVATFDEGHFCRLDGVEVVPLLAE